MKKFRVICLGMMLLVLAWGGQSQSAQAAGSGTILAGIYLDDISLEGMTTEEAESMVDSKLTEWSKKQITLVTVDDHEVQITPAEIGFSWNNPEVIEEAASIGQKGNVVQRYKVSKDLQHENQVFTMQFSCDEDLLRQVINERCGIYDHDATDATLTRENGAFVVNAGQNGEKLDVDASVQLVENYLCNGWDKQDARIELSIVVDESRGTAEELSKVKDVLGTFSTSFKTSGSGRSANVRNGCSLINGTTLYPGDEFSTYETVSPFSEANGYYLAGSYLNGQVVDSLGGGICQVSTTLYNAVLLSELEVTERHNHSMIVSYVDPSADAAISESAGKDFKFVNNTDAPIYIEGYTTDDKRIVFTIYGEETRDAGHQVRYESEVVSKTVPDTEVIYTDAAAPIGSVTVQSAHIGYKANLWKIVTENGEQVSREMVNSSTYKMVPRSATVGVATSDPNAYNEIMAAIATNNIDHVRNVAAALAAGATTTEQTAQPADQATQQTQQTQQSAEQTSQPAAEAAPAADQPAQ